MELNYLLYAALERKLIIIGVDRPGRINFKINACLGKQKIIIPGTYVVSLNVLTSSMPFGLYCAHMWKSSLNHGRSHLCWTFSGYFVSKGPKNSLKCECGWQKHEKFLKGICQSSGENGMSSFLLFALFKRQTACSWGLSKYYIFEYDLPAHIFSPCIWIRKL